MRQLPGSLTVIFDGSCDFCTWSANVLDRLDRDDRVTVVPFQAPGVLKRYGLATGDAEAAVWAMSPSGTRYRGAAAVNLSLAVALGTHLPMVLYLVPGIRQVQDALYAIVARNRHHLKGVTPYCQQHPDVCV